MTKIMREYDRPIINVEHTEYGMRPHHVARDRCRAHPCARHHQVFPHAFVIPMNTEMTITQYHVPIDDENCYCTRSSPASRRRSTRKRCASSGCDLRIARLQVAPQQGERLRLRSARAGDRDLHRHGQRHQRARPVGHRIDGRDPGPHQGASRHRRQGDRAISPAAAASRSRRSPRARSRSCAWTRRMPAASRGRAPMDGIGPTQGWECTGWKLTSSGAAAHPGCRRCRARSRTRCGICRRRSDGFDPEYTFRHCEERSDEAIHSFFARRDGFASLRSQ